MKKPHHRSFVVGKRKLGIHITFIPTFFVDQLKFSSSLLHE